MLDVFSLETPQLNGPHLAWKGERPGFSLVAAGALDFRRGHQEPAGGLRKGRCPYEMLGGISGFLSPDAGA